ncbi:serine protease filzig [Cylas formicarius]|uniref:serine protease filzig n=1 Tax=Cylas formicarius TaxID=197179 RepID=UPI00295836D0|nr:serine protease filzig [Cylas formicarius]
MKWQYCFLGLACLVLADSTAIRQAKGVSSRGPRKLFGGYRITPKYCAATLTHRNSTGGPTVCMFNHECLQRDGLVVGACMDGFLFGACCQLPLDSSVGDLVEYDRISIPSLENELSSKVSPTTHRSTPGLTDITSSGVSQITAALLGGGSLMPTAQDNTVIEINGQDHWTNTGVTHPQAADTIVDNADNEISATYFRPTYQPQNTIYTTSKMEASTTRYADTYPPILQISVSNAPIGYTPLPTFEKPAFRPKPPKPTDENYVLVPTIAHEIQNKTPPIDSIINILGQLNRTTTGKPISTFSYASSSYITRQPSQTTKKLPSTSYVFSTTIPPRRTTETTAPTPAKYTINKEDTYPTTNTGLSTSFVYLSTFKPTKTPKPPSTSYVYDPSFKPTRTPKPPSTSYVYNPSFKPTKTPKPAAHSTFANSPDAFPGSSTPSYVYGTTPSVVTSNIAGPGFTVTSQPGQYSPFPSPAPTVIVLGPVSGEGGTVFSSTQPQLVPVPTRFQSTTTTRPQLGALPQRKPVNQVTINNHVTQNIYSTQRPQTSSTSQDLPSPTVLITPKPTISSSLAPLTAEDSEVIEVTAQDEMINFPPDRHPNLNISVPLYSEDDITTPSFVESDEMNDKVESFVNEILIGLQEPFNDLKNIVYSNSTPSSSATTKKPVKKQGTTTKKPATKPSSIKTTTKRPVTTKPVTTRRPTTTVPTRKQTTTTRKPTTTKKSPTTTQNLIESTLAAQDYRDSCGVRPLVKTGRIVGGKGAVFGEFPWQVLVRESTWLGLFTKNKCGGVLISDKYVMTAAHCQPGFLASLVAVFGEFDISGDLESRKPVSRNVKRVIVHRKYDPATFENDLALLELDSPVKFDAHIIPICLPRDGEDFTGRVATVTGWGRLKYGGGVPSVLQEVQVPIMENHVCQEMFRTAGHTKVIMESFLCAGYANGQKDSCEGDSGGPLVLQRPDGRYQLAGTVSHGIKCAAPYLPGVYMRTTYFKPWITSITGIE